jgi:hypothetical protein
MWICTSSTSCKYIASFIIKNREGSISSLTFNFKRTRSRETYGYSKMLASSVLIKSDNIICLCKSTVVLFGFAISEVVLAK